MEEGKNSCVSKLCVGRDEQIIHCSIVARRYHDNCSPLRHNEFRISSNHDRRLTEDFLSYVMNPIPYKIETGAFHAVSHPVRVSSSVYARRSTTTSRGETAVPPAEGAEGSSRRLTQERRIVPTSCRFNSGWFKDRP